MWLTYGGRRSVINLANWRARRASQQQRGGFPLVIKWMNDARHSSSESFCNRQLGKQLMTKCIPGIHIFSMDPPVIVSMCTVTNEVAAVIFWQIYTNVQKFRKLNLMKYSPTREGWQLLDEFWGHLRIYWHEWENRLIGIHVTLI